MMRRSWLFVPGADEAAHEAAARSGADVIVLELEDFTPPDLRPKARALAAQAFGRWRKAGAVTAVRVNPLETCGRDDLRVVMLARPDVVMMSKVVSPEQVRSLAELAPMPSSCQTSKPPPGCCTLSRSARRARA